MNNIPNISPLMQIVPQSTTFFTNYPNYIDNMYLQETLP